MYSHLVVAFTITFIHPIERQFFQLNRLVEIIQDWRILCAAWCVSLTHSLSKSCFTKYVSSSPNHLWVITLINTSLKSLLCAHASLLHNEALTGPLTNRFVHYVLKIDTCIYQGQSVDTLLNFKLLHTIISKSFSNCIFNMCKVDSLPGIV